MPIDLELVRARVSGRPAADLDGPDIRKRAAVAAILRDGGRGVEVLFIRRAERPGDPWSGQMAFPGGRHEPSDLDLGDTARRETFEEIGLVLPEQGRVIGRLDDVRTHTGDMIVRPYVWALETPVVLQPNAEVAEVLWADLASMASGARDTSYRWSEGPAAMTFPGYDVEGHVVWGLTHRILGTLLRALK